MIEKYYAENYNRQGTAEEMKKWKEDIVDQVNMLVEPLSLGILGLGRDGKATGRGLATKILSDPALVTNIQDAINDMVGKGWGKPMPDKKDEWIKQNPSVDPGILNLLYNNIAVAKKYNYNDVKDAFLRVNVTEGDSTKSVLLNDANQMTPWQIILKLQNGIEEEFSSII
jgi:hypothetical protein